MLASSILRLLKFVALTYLERTTLTTILLGLLQSPGSATSKELRSTAAHTEKGPQPRPQPAPCPHCGPQKRTRLQNVLSPQSLPSLICWCLALFDGPLFRRADGDLPSFSWIQVQQYWLGQDGGCHFRDLGDLDRTLADGMDRTSQGRCMAVKFPAMLSRFGSDSLLDLSTPSDCLNLSVGWWDHSQPNRAVGIRSMFAIYCSRRESQSSSLNFDCSLPVQSVQTENRGAFSSVEAACQNFFEIVSFLSTIIFSNPERFRWPSLMSIVAVAIASILYTTFLRLERGHLLHLEGFRFSEMDASVRHLGLYRIATESNA